MKHLKKINRFEIIDWTRSAKVGLGFSKWIDEKFHVYYDLQDKGRTMKIFLTDEELKGGDENA